MKRAVVLVFIASLLVTRSAHAAKAEVIWTNPSTNTDGSALTTLSGIRIYAWPCAAASPPPSAALQAWTIAATVDGQSMSAVITPTVGAGPLLCVAATALTNTGLESAMSPVVTWQPPATLGQPGAISGVIHLEFSHAPS